MTKDFFYMYDFYMLEQKHKENEFVMILEEIPDLNDSVKPFIDTVVDLLFTSIMENRQKEAVPEVKIPKIKRIMADALRDNILYESYFNAKSEDNLIEKVFKKLLKRLFAKDGYNDEKYAIERYMHSWLEKRLAFAIASDERYNSVKILTALIRKTEMLHGLYHYLIERIPFSWIKDNEEDWINVSVNAEIILDGIKTFDREYFINYRDLIVRGKDQELWNFVCNTTDGSNYAMLNEEFAFRSQVLLKNDLQLWIAFWDNFELPIIQDCIFDYFFESKPELYLQVADVLISNNPSMKSELDVMLMLIAKNYFEASMKLTERLSFYEDEGRMKIEDQGFFAAGQKYYREWLTEKPNYYSGLIKNLQLKLSHHDIEDWIFSYKLKKIDSDYLNKSAVLYNKEVALLTNAYKSALVLPNDLRIESFNLQKFTFYVELIPDTGDGKMKENVLNALFLYLSSDQFFWDKSFSELDWSVLKGMSYLISLQAHPLHKAKELISRFMVRHQGWKPAKINYKPVSVESYIYSGIGLLFEYPSVFVDEYHKDLFFKELLDVILTQDRYSQIDYSDYYQQPLHILFLVANQLYPAVKEHFEQEVIKSYDNLFSLILILANDKYPISEESKPMMAARLEKEFLIEKRKFNNKGQQQKIVELEKLITGLKLG